MNALKVQDSYNGKGVFTDRTFMKGELLLVFQGDRFSSSELPVPYTNAEDYYLQIGYDLYLGPSGNIDDYVNHSCDPNAYLIIGNTVVSLHAFRDIVPGTEITFDYSTTMDEDDWTMECHCNSPYCRKVITDFKHMPTERQQQYLASGAVPIYIRNSLVNGFIALDEQMDSLLD